MLDENLPTFYFKPSSDNPQSTTVFLSQNGSELQPEYSLRRPDPNLPASKNCYAVALYDSYNPEVLYAEVLVQPEWQQPSLSQAEIRAQNGAPPPPVPIVPERFVVQLYNPDQQVTIKQIAGSWNSSAHWEFEMPQTSFRQPSVSAIDRTQNDPTISEVTPKLTFKWKRDGKLSKDISCFMAGKSTDGRKQKEPDILCAMVKGGNLTLYQPNMHRVDIEDAKGLEVVLLLGASVIKDIYFNPNREMFNISSPQTNPKRKNSGPAIGGKPSASPTDSEGLSSNEHTPTTYGAHSSGGLPETIITEWTADECADFVSSLGLRQYQDQFLENEIVGEALVALQHDDLKQMGVTSVGHRLTILKSVYDIKIKQDIPLESDHYVPLSADAEAQYATATLKDIKFLAEQLRMRDERINMAEDQLRRITAEYARLREDLLPVFKMAKEREPLPFPSAGSTNAQNPYPYENNNTISPPAPTPSSIPSGGGLSRKFSTKKLFLDSTPKNASPTYLPSTQERSLMEQALDPANAAERAVLSSSHLAAMNGSQTSTSPGYPSPNQPSPTSPPTLSGSTLASRSYRSDLPTPARSTFQNDNDQYQPSTYSRDSTKPAPLRRAQTPAPDTPAGGSGGASVEIFKSFRVSMEDPCYKVLPAALKKYNINAPWEQYALYIVYGDKERCLGMEEKPLILFKQLDKEGKKPMFMLRKISPSADVAGDGPGSAGLERRTPHSGNSYDPPGGII